MDGSTRIPLTQLISTLVSNGIDPNRAEIKSEIEAVTVGDEVDLSIVLAHENSIVCKALTGNLAMKDWKNFVGTLQNIFGEIKRDVHAGDPASYIPILAEANREWFAASVCTVDGQQWSTGDLDVTFSIQSCTKPIMYAVAVEDRGLSYVHRNGPSFEPSGLSFNEVSLNSKGQPHNPYINSGAIATGALVGPGLDAAAKFRHFMGRLQEMAGGHKIGFSHATYLCEHETAWRNNALVAFMQDAGVFPKSVNPIEALDFYLQCCSIEVDTRSAATIAATLANGGVCPLNGRRALNPTTVKSTISLMFSCGMYDYSGTWMSTVGLPAKSGVAGLIYVVIPHVMGLAVFSPPLDSHGNSVRGVEFCKKLLKQYPFGIFDQIVRGARFAQISSGGSAAAGAAGPSPVAGKQAPPPPMISGASKKSVLTQGSSGSTVTAADNSSVKGDGAEDELLGSFSPDKANGLFSGHNSHSAAGGYSGASVISVSAGGHIGQGSGAIARNRHHRKSVKPNSSSSSSSSSEDKSYHTGAARMDCWQKIFKALIKVHRALRKLRVWCGLPVTQEDLSRLLAAAAKDNDVDQYPEIRALLPPSGKAGAGHHNHGNKQAGGKAGSGSSSALLPPLAPSQQQQPAMEDRGLTHETLLEGDAETSWELYRDFRSVVAPRGCEIFSVEESVGAAAAAASGRDLPAAATDAEILAGLSADLVPSTYRLPVAALKRFIEQQGISTGPDFPHMHALWKQLLDRAAKGTSAAAAAAKKAAAASAYGKSAFPLTPGAPPSTTSNDTEERAAHASVAFVTSVVSFSLRDLFLPNTRNNVILRTLLGALSMPNFRSFVEDMMSIFESVKRKTKEGTTFNRLDIDELAHADPEAFGVAVCTVDGQMLHIGDTDVEFPLMGAVRPLIYALACTDVGVAEVERWVGVEPTAAAVDTFSLMPAGGGSHGGGDHCDTAPPPMPDDGFEHPEPSRPLHPRPFNPFLDSGALAISALLGRAHYPNERRLFHDNGSRFSHMIHNFQKWCGGRKIGFNNSVFLAQKQKRLKTVAISYYAKGMGVYPASSDPTETAHMLFQAEAIATNAENLSVIAATLANIGVCPLTQERCLSPDVMKQLLSLMYNSGLCRYTGNWMFQVGIPSAAGVSGAHMVVIPGVAGIVIYSPRLNEFDVPARAARFCELLTSRYRVNVFDQLVYADQDVAINADSRTNNHAVNMEQSLMQYELCTAASAGDMVKVKELLEDGADPNLADYDLRTALHIACSDGKLDVVHALIEAGAAILAQDRWGATPLDDARRRGHTAIITALTDALSMQGVRIPPPTALFSATAGATVLGGGSPTPAAGLGGSSGSDGGIDTADNVSDAGRSSYNGSTNLGLPMGGAGGRPSRSAAMAAAPPSARKGSPPISPFQHQPSASGAATERKSVLRIPSTAALARSSSRE